VALQIINAGPPQDDVTEQLRKAIREALPDSKVQVEAKGPGHFEVCVIDEAFRDLSRVKQQQLVYKAITSLMAGDGAPVHAIDRLDCLVPE